MKKTIIAKKTILANKFVKLIEESHEEITEIFMNDLLRHPETEAYRNSDRDDVYRFSDLVYKDLSVWISKEFSKEKIEERYGKMGKERCEAGIPVEQVLKALVLQRRHIWLFVMDKMYGDTTDYMEALELNNRVTLYFDRAMIAMVKGYMKMMDRRMR
ncbi:MAG TPA: hypothetical protein PKX62_05305 [Spirochaetota bacterium]|nr:hypothetical protein [Spirochaetota bacterium]